MIEHLYSFLLAGTSTLLISAAIYFSIRYLAFKRSFPLPHTYDFLWIIATLLTLFLVSVFRFPEAAGIHPKILTWIEFSTFLLYAYLAIFILDQFLVEYFLVTMLKVYVSPPLRKGLVLFAFGIML